MKKNTLFLFVLTFLSISFTKAQTTNSFYIVDSESLTGRTIEFEFSENLVINQPMDVVICDNFDDSSDGVSVFDLTIVNEEVSTDSDVVITYHKSQIDANNGSNPILETKNYSSSGETIYIRAENAITSDFETTSFKIEVNLIPEAIFDSQYNYEVSSNTGNPIEIGLIPSNFKADQVDVTWYLDSNIISGETGLKLSSVHTKGDYSAIIRFNSTGCQSNLISISVAESLSTVFPQGISPTTSPGLNDTFDLSSHNVTRLEIFNRNGVRVYSKSNYTNEWVGQTDSGEELPVGTYFYTMQFDGGSQQRSAWVYLNR